MKRKFHWTLTMTQENFITQLNEANSRGFTIRVDGDKIKIKKTKYVFAKAVSLYPQPSIIIYVSRTGNGVELDGKLRLRPSFYISISLLFLIYAVFDCINSHNFIDFLITIIPLGVITSLFLVFTSIFIKRIFYKETNDIIRFLEAICA